MFISFKHKNILDILKIKKNTKVGLSFGTNTSVKNIVKQAKNKAIDCLILDKSFLENQKINNLNKEKYFIQSNLKRVFKYQNNNLIFENL